MCIRSMTCSSILIAALGLSACSDEAPESPSAIATPSPSPTPFVVTHIRGVGNVAIEYEGASIPPGATIAGCGPDIGGCRGRLSMTFWFIPFVSGSTLESRVVLHATTQQACLIGRMSPMQLVAGERKRIVMEFNDSQECAVPVKVATMALNIEGGSATASRGEWNVSYSFER